MNTNGPYSKVEQASQKFRLSSDALSEGVLVRPSSRKKLKGVKIRFYESRGGATL